MIIKRTMGSRAFDLFNYLLLAFVVVATLYPFLYIIFASVSDPVEMERHTGLLLKPYGFQLKTYGMVLKNEMVINGYKNTIIYVLLGTGINILLTSMSAYVLSRKGYFWKKFLTLFAVFTMFFSGGMVPYYLVVKALNMDNSIWAIILPSAIITYNLIIMRTSFMAIPDSMEESAKMDGANDFIVLFRIIMPLSMPIIAVMILFYGVYHWNAWFNAMIFLRKRTMYPLQLILREILITSTTENMTAGIASDDHYAYGQSVKYATIIFTTLPIIFIYPFLQKYFVKGVMIGAVKG